MWTEEQQQQLSALAASGISAAEIGDAIGVSRHAVIGRARRTGVKLRDNPTRRYSANEILEIRRLYEHGHTYSQIAKRIGTSEHYVWLRTSGLPRRRARPATAPNWSHRRKVRAIARAMLGEKRPAIARSLGVYLGLISYWEHDPLVLADAAKIAQRVIAMRTAREETRRTALQEEARRRAEYLRLKFAGKCSERNLSIGKELVLGVAAQTLAKKHSVTRQRIFKIRNWFEARGALF